MFALPAKWRAATWQVMQRNLVNYSYIEFLEHQHFLSWLLAFLFKVYNTRLGLRQSIGCQFLKSSVIKASCFLVSMKRFRVSNFMRIFYRNFCCSESWGFLRSSSVKTKFFYFIFVHHWTLFFRNFYTILFAVFFYETPGVEYPLQAIRQQFSPWHILCKSAGNENCFSKENTNWLSIMWQKTHDWGIASLPFFEKERKHSAQSPYLSEFALP